MTGRQKSTEIADTWHVTRGPQNSATAQDSLAHMGHVSPHHWADALVTAHHDIAPKPGAAIHIEDFHVVAVRFDPCDGSTIGECAGEPAGRLRLVLQPLYTDTGTGTGTTFAHDVAVHAGIPDKLHILPLAN